MRKVLIFSGIAMVAFVFGAVVFRAHTFRPAYAFAAEAAAEVAAEGDGAPGFGRPDGCFCYGNGNGRAFGPRFGMMGRGMQGRGMMMWRGGDNDGRGVRDGRGWRGAPNFRQGWRNRDNDSERGERFGRGERFNRGERFGQRQGAEGGGQFGMPRFMEEIELTAEQKQQMIDVATENFRNRLQLRWELEDARSALRKANEAETPDYDAIVAANAALGSVQGKLDVARRKVWDDFGAVLTPEQQEIIAKYREDGDEDGDDREDRRAERRERRQNREK